MTAGDKPEEGGDDVKSSCPYDLGYTRATMDGTKSARPRGGANLIKPFSVRIVGQLAYMKLESLVIADQHAAVNTFPALYTPPVTPREFVTPEVGGVTFGASRLRWDR